MTQRAPATNHRTVSTERRLLCVLVVILYLISCATPVIQTKAVVHDGRRGEWGGGMKSTAYPGWVALLVGWMPRDRGQSTRMPWSANLFLFAGLAFLLFDHPRIAIVLGIMGSLAGLSVFLLAADPTAGIEAIRWGCYCWLASLFSFTFGVLFICMASCFGGKSQADKGVTEGKAIMD
jgi:hypothetical protein